MSDPHPWGAGLSPHPIPEGDVPWWYRVTQLLERLNRVVEEGNLFDPARPSLGSELEALRHDLEALSSGPGTRESHLDRPTGAPGEAGWGGLRPCFVTPGGWWPPLPLGPPVCTVLLHTHVLWGPRPAACCGC